MPLRILPLTSLKPAPYNPRKPLRPGSPGYRRLARSLAEFDLVQPVVWNERTGHVVAGHQRLQILKDRGESHVECVVVDLPLEKEKALNVALNNAAVGSDWDDAKLRDLLAELADVPDFDATLTGFDPAELADLLLAPAPPAPDPPRDADEPNAVRVTFLIPPADWETLRPALDTFLAEHPVEAHIKLPR
jgi:ParB-like chromosome segregation protein Spo0J